VLYHTDQFAEDAWHVTAIDLVDHKIEISVGVVSGILAELLEDTVARLKRPFGR